MSQAYILCGYFRPGRAYYLPEEELARIEGRSCIILRIYNCTGNLIDLTESVTNEAVSNEELERAKIALSIDSNFKNKRRRKVFQIVNMTLRQRMVSAGFYDYTIKRWVKPQ